MDPLEEFPAFPEVSGVRVVLAEELNDVSDRPDEEAIFSLDLKNKVLTLKCEKCFNSGRAQAINY